MKPRRRRWKYIAAAAVVVIVIGMAVQRKLFPLHPAAQLLTVPATIADIELDVVANGTLQPKQLVNVGAQVSGQLKSLKVNLGDRVAKHQLIAEIDPALAENALRSAQATLNSLRAQRRSAAASLVLAEQTFHREEALVTQGFTSRGDYETATATLDGRRADIEALDAQIVGAEITLNTAQVNVGYTKIVAPIDGTVVGIVTKQGQTVNSAQTAPTIVMLAKLDDMVVTAQISEADVAKVATGQTVYFTTLGDPDHRYYGKLQTLDPAPESFVDDNNGSNGSSNRRNTALNNSVYYLARFDTDNTAGKLRSGMTVQVNIVLDEAKHAITIPSVALGKRTAAGHDTVQVVNAAGRTETRDVRVGLNNNVTAQIIDGLKADERVVAGSPDGGGHDTAEAPK
jgi:membrane fusion protein, macrolide-specific efflux system